MLIAFASSLDPDQTRQNVGPDLDPNCLTLMVFRKEFFKRIDCENNQQMTKMLAKFPSKHRVKKKSIYSQDFITLEQA